MSGEPKMFRIDPENRESEAIDEVEFARLGLQERRDIQEWVAANPGILGDDLLMVGKEFSGFDRTSERLDLLAVDTDGKLVIIELKRDDTGADAHWQAIKYASYLRKASPEEIIRILADYAKIAEEEAEMKLREHLDADDLNDVLNKDQRIIIASHRFAPEVTSAVLWLNEKFPDENRITCVQLVPYHDKITGSLYVQASTIIPVPGVDEYVIRVSDATQEGAVTRRGSFADNLKNAYDRNRNDAVTHFLRKAATAAKDSVPIEIRPDKQSKWAGRHGDQIGRYYHLWYSRTPWANWNGMSYRINLWPQDGSKDWRADVEFWYEGYDLSGKLADILPFGTHEIEPNRLIATVGVATLTDGFSEEIADTVRMFIEAITPVANVFVEEGNEEEG